MSPTSCQTAPPRTGGRSLPMAAADIKKTLVFFIVVVAGFVLIPGIISLELDPQ